MGTRTGDSHGAVLLETLIALVLLAAIGGAAAWSASESLRMVARTHERDAVTRLAARLMGAVSLWPREDLDRHLGITHQGPLSMRIDRPRPALYAVTLSDSAGGRPVLATVLFRPDSEP